MAAPTTTNRLIFYLNGERVEEGDPNPSQPLLRYLRDKRHLTGTKLGCGDGGCGACTVMISRWNNGDDGGSIEHRAINACITPLASIHMSSITTVEGVGTRRKPHPLQERLVDTQGTQCGFKFEAIVIMDLTGTYNLVSSDNFDDFLKEMGVGLALRTMAGKAKPDVEITQKGDDYKIRTVSTFKTTEINFKLGVEFEEDRADGVKVKSTVTREGDKLIHAQKGGKVNTTLVRDFNATGFTLECSANAVKSVRKYAKK